MADISQIKLPDNTVYNIKDSTAIHQITSSHITTALGFTPVDASLKGTNNGIAELDSSGKVPASQLPSYVDDVLEYSTEADFPSAGETGKIYVDTTTNKTYRWSGNNYVEISASLALGITSSTAFRGDYGNAAYNHAVINKGSAFNSGLYKIATNDEGHVISATAVEKADLTSLGVADALNIPTKTSDLTNDSGFIITETDPTVPAWAKASTKPSYTAAEVGALRELTIDADTTQSDNGLPENVSARADSITISETNHHAIGSLHFQVYKDGSVMTQLSSVNYVGSQWKKEGISITLAKSGTVSYIISSPEAFRSAISAAIAPLIINTSNVYSTDALTYGTTVTLTEGQLLFVFLSKKMQGLANATLKLGNNDAINIYLTTSIPLNAAFAQGSVLGLVYHNNNLYMINPPVAI